MEVTKILKRFDQHLSAKNLYLEGVIVGGSSLVLLGVTNRQTQDVDLLNENIEEKILKEAKIFALKEGISEVWLNNEPAPLRRDLPMGWEKRLVVAFEGSAILFKTLARQDLLKTKLWALCDRTRDLEDVLALQPTLLELQEALAWLEPLDLNPNWPAHAKSTIEFVAKKLGY
jgi:Nucleotidyltransferase of unknown function (DUF6036)